MGQYTISRKGITLTAGNDVITFTSPNPGRITIKDVHIEGEQTVSTVVRLILQRSTVGTTPVAVTPEKRLTAQKAATGTYASGWTTQPTLSGGPHQTWGLNAFGGIVRNPMLPDEDLVLINGEQASLRADVGTGAVVDVTVLFDED